MTSSKKYRELVELVQELGRVLLIPTQPGSLMTKIPVRVKIASFGDISQKESVVKSVFM